MSAKIKKLMSAVEVENNFVLLTGTANPKLAEDIGNHLDLKVHQAVGQRFADGEPDIQIPINIRRREVFIIQPTSPPHVSRNLKDLELIIQAARLASASQIHAIVPYFGFSRGDRKSSPRTPIPAKSAARGIERHGATSLLSMDIHNETVQGYVDIPWDFVYSMKAMHQALQFLDPSELVVVSPDKGGFARATAYAKRLNASGVAVVFKEHDVNVANKTEAVDMIGEVKNKVALVVDDIYDTGGTLKNASLLLQHRGAKKVIAAIAHGVFSARSIENLEKSRVESLFITDTIDLPHEVRNHRQVKLVQVSHLLAEAIKCVYTGESISEKLFI